MNDFVHSSTGLVHVLTAIAAMVVGAIVLLIKKEQVSIDFLAICIST